MTWEIEWEAAASRDFRRLERATADRIRIALLEFAEAERGDVIKLQGLGQRWRLRVGDWRVLLTFDYPRGVVTILRVLHRREAYR